MFPAAILNRLSGSPEGQRRFKWDRGLKEPKMGPVKRLERGREGREGDTGRNKRK